MKSNLFPLDARQAFWKIVAHRLELAAADPPLSRQEAAEFLAQLPPRRGHETVGDRIRRATQSMPTNVIYVNFRPLIGIQRLAADSGEVAPLPDPNRPLESADGRFRLWMTAASGKIQLTLEALNFASDEFAGCHLGLATVGDWSEQATEQIVRLDRDAVIAEWTLNEDGDGTCEIPDTVETRRALLQPIIGLIQDDR